MTGYMGKRLKNYRRPSPEESTDDASIDCAAHLYPSLPDNTSRSMLGNI